MKFILADDVRDVFKAALLEFKPKVARPTLPKRTRTRSVRSSVHP